MFVPVYKFLGLFKKILPNIKNNIFNKKRDVSMSKLHFDMFLLPVLNIVKQRCSCIIGQGKDVRKNGKDRTQRYGAVYLGISALT